MKEVILTKKGYEKLKKEIEYLSTDKRREVAERIRVAREFGDIAENAEYDDAKNEQAHARAPHRDARGAAAVGPRDREEGHRQGRRLGRLERSRLKDMAANKTFEYQIVGSAEANPAESKLSNESPVGKAILGRKKGEIVEVAAPRGS